MDIAKENESRPAAEQLYRYSFDAISFDEASRVFCVDNVPTKCEALPLDVLCLLLRSPNEVIAHAHLLRLVWGGRSTTDHVLTSAINKLRTALGPASAKRIVTVPRVGYKFDGTLERRATGRQPVATMQLAGGHPVPDRDGWRLLRKLGANHRVEVWLAEDTALGLTRVFKFASGGDDFSALKHEYTVYRALRKELGDREDLAQVLSCNFRTSPYFIEYAYGGENLAAWSADGNRLHEWTEATRIGLFLRIAAAVEAAHSVGVLHKDVKPQNVLVAPAAANSTLGWDVRLTDFGNSRLLEPQRLAELGITAQGMTVTDAEKPGTPMYLAPELLAGNPSTIRSDVYSLGVLLYQLLIGDFRRPMSNGWQRDLGDMLLIEDVTAATEGRPADRLSSVGELTTRLAMLERRRDERAARQREAVEATDLAARLLRVRQRRPWIVGAVVSLTLGVVGALTLLAHARHAEQLALGQSRRAQAINDFLIKDVLNATDASNLDSATPATMTETLRRASNAASVRFRDDPLTEASVRVQLAQTEQHMSDFNAAIAEYVRAVQLFAAHVASNDPTLIETRLDLADMLAGNSKLPEAQEQLDLATAQLPNTFSKTDAVLENKLVNARFASLYMGQHYGEALQPGMRMLELERTLPSSTLRTRYAANQRMGDLYFRLGRLKDSETLLAQNLQPPMSPQTLGAAVYARAQIAYARTRIAGGKLDGTEATLLAARSTLADKLGPNDYFVAVANLQLGDLYNARAEFAKAVPALQTAYAGLVAKYGAGHQTTRITALNLAITSLNAGHAAAALRQLDLDRKGWIADGALESNPIAQIVDFSRARALCDLHRSTEGLKVLQPLDPTRLSEAEPSADWQWRLQAERGRAMATSGARDSGLALLRSAIGEMARANSVPWVLASYRKALDQLERSSHALINSPPAHS